MNHDDAVPVVQKEISTYLQFVGNIFTTVPETLTKWSHWNWSFRSRTNPRFTRSARTTVYVTHCHQTVWTFLRTTQKRSSSWYFGNEAEEKWSYRLHILEPRHHGTRIFLTVSLQYFNHNDFVTFNKTRIGTIEDIAEFDHKLSGEHCNRSRNRWKKLLGKTILTYDADGTFNASQSFTYFPYGVVIIFT